VYPQQSGRPCESTCEIDYPVWFALEHRSNYPAGRSSFVNADRSRRWPTAGAYAGGMGRRAGHLAVGGVLRGPRPESTSMTPTSTASSRTDYTTEPTSGTWTLIEQRRTPRGLARRSPLRPICVSLRLHRRPVRSIRRSDLDIRASEPPGRRLHVITCRAQNSRSRRDMSRRAVERAPGIGKFERRSRRRSGPAAVRDRLVERLDVS